MELQHIADGGRNNAGGTIGRRGDNTSANGVLLVDRHGIDAEPVIGEQRIAPVLLPFILQLVMQDPGASAHLQAARHDAFA